MTSGLLDKLKLKTTLTALTPAHRMKIPLFSISSQRLKNKPKNLPNQLNPNLSSVDWSKFATLLV
jgi:hypothetical protein